MGLKKILPLLRRELCVCTSRLHELGQTAADLGGIAVLPSPPPRLRPGATLFLHVIRDVPLVRSAYFLHLSMMKGGGGETKNSIRYFVQRHAGCEFDVRDVVSPLPSFGLVYLVYDEIPDYLVHDL